jgi:hypothetical protein
MRRVWALGFAALTGVAACSSGQAGNGTGGTGGGAGGGTTATTAASGTGGSGSTDTWTSYAQGFFAMYCVECHGASDPDGRDFTKLSVVQAQKAEIRCGVAPVVLSGCSGFPPPKQFPISNAAGTNPKPTDAERDRIILWIDAGAM